MLFITNPHLRKLEAFMQEVPNFPPKGDKVDLDSLEDEILLFEIENVIINVKPPNENLNIRKDNIMKFRNEKHRSTFLNEAKKQSLKNYNHIVIFGYGKVLVFKPFQHFIKLGITLLGLGLLQFFRLNDLILA